MDGLIEIRIWNSFYQRYSTVVCDSTTESLWSLRFAKLDRRWIRGMNDGMHNKHLTLLVRMETTLRASSNDDIIAALEELSDIEIAYLDLLLHEMSGAIWNSGHVAEIEESWGRLGIAYSPPPETMEETDS